MWMAVVDAEEEAVAAGLFVDPQVEDRYCPESDRDKETETLRACSRRAESENMPESESDEEMEGGEVVVARRGISFS